MEGFLKGFPVIIEQSVQWSDMDAHGHVNNVFYFRYIENARIAYYERIGKYQFEEDTGIGFILAFTACKFKSELFYPDTICVGARMADIKEDRATMEYRIWSNKQKRIAAEAEATLVSYSRNKNMTVPFPGELRRRILNLENELP